MSETVQATAVLAGRHGVLIRGGSGVGKSVLAIALIARGGWLIADDRVHLSARDGRLVASAHAPVAGQIELRGRGIVRVPHERSGVVRLVVDIVGAEVVDRLPGEAQLTASLLGIDLPRQPVPARSPMALVLTEAALRALAPAGRSGLHPGGVWG